VYRQWYGSTLAAQAGRLETLCTANGLHGIEVHEQAQPTLEGNTCRENKQGGIVYFGSALAPPGRTPA
jgi:parallel beta-helix repeat protein